MAQKGKLSGTTSPREAATRAFRGQPGDETAVPRDTWAYVSVSQAAFSNTVIVRQLGMEEF